MKRRALFSLLPIGLLSIKTGSAQVPGLGTIFGVGGATEVTQLLNYAQLVGMTLNQVQQIQHALNTYNQIVTAGRLLSQLQWTSAAGDIANILKLAQVGQGIGFGMAQMDQAFRVAYPGFANSNAPYFNRYQTWANVALDTMQGTLRGINFSSANFASEQEVLLKLQDHASGAVGQMQAIQAGNEMAGETVKQLQKLREIMLADVQSKAAFQGYAVQKDAFREGKIQDFFSPGVAGRDGVGW